MNATTQLETAIVKARKGHGLGNQQPSAVASQHGEGSTIIPMGVDPEQGRSARCLTTKTCTQCAQVLPVDGFYFNRLRNGHDSRCKGCRKATSTVWRAANPEKAKAIVLKASRKFTETNRDKCREKNRVWYSQNADAQRERSKRNHIRFAARRLEYRKWYEATFPEKTRERASKRRAIRARAIPEWADFDAIKALYLEAKAKGLEVDHMVPLNSKLVCGLHCEANMQLLTRADNIRKGNRWWPGMP